MDVNVPRIPDVKTNKSKSESDKHKHIKSSNSEGKHSEQEQPSTSHKAGAKHTGLRTKRIVVYDHCDIIGDQFWEDNPEILGDDENAPAKSKVPPSTQGEDKNQDKKFDCELIENLDDVIEVPFPKQKLYQCIKSESSGDSSSEQGELKSGVGTDTRSGEAGECSEQGEVNSTGIIGDSSIPEKKVRST